jgi:hypothetical protein
MRIQRISFLFLALIGLGAPVLAQSSTGAVIGRVFDLHEALVPGATVHLKNTGTGAERSATSNSEGIYNFIAVMPGKYTVSAQAKGFATASLNIEVTVAESTRADIKLGIEALQETTNIINEAGVSVQTEDAQLGSTVSQREITELPSSTRNPYDFIGASGGASASNDLRGVGLAVNGQRPASGNYILDGGENNDTFLGAPAQLVPLDAVQEFRVQTNYTAEYGRNAGFIANVVTKSGTNDVHGDLYEFNRNSALSANTFDNNANSKPRPVFNRNQFGGTLGGPIRHNQFFFFGSFEGVRVRSSFPVPFFVPTPQLLTITSPATLTIFQKFPLPSGLSTTNVKLRTVCPFGVTCNATTGAGFVTIPAFTFVTRTGPQNAGAGPPQNTYLATGRIDYNMNSKTQLFGRYAFQTQDFFASVFQPYSATLDQPSTQRNQNVLLNLTRDWSSRMVTESRLVYNRVLFAQPHTPDPTVPSFFIQGDGIATLPAGGTAFGGPQNLYQFFQTASLIRGKHTVRFGGQYIHIRDDRTFGAAEAGTAGFAGTQGFVNGELGSYSIAINPQGHFPGEQINPPFGPPSFARHFHYNEIGLFIQDTWKVTRRLTLAPGLRWEYFGVLHSTGAEKPLDANFYFGAGSSFLEQIANGRFFRTIDAPGKYRNHFYLPDYKDFSPRLGLAYDVFGDGRTIFRTGAGIYYDRNFGNVLFNVIQNPPNYSTTRINNIPFNPAVLDNRYAAFPNAPITLPVPASRNLDPNLKTAYTISWSARIEREIGKVLVASATYLGASGNRLYTLNNINRVGSGVLLGRPGTRLNGLASNLLTRGNEAHSSYHSLQLEVASGFVERLGLKFGVGYTWSHSIDNRSSVFADDFVAGQAIGFLDAFNPALDRGDSDFDVRHRLGTSFIWEIPLARHSQRAVAKQLLGGWEMSGILSFQTGQPFGLFDSATPGIANDTTRPRLTGHVPQFTLVPDAVTPNAFLFIPINQIRDAADNCMPNATPFACEPSINGPFDGIISRNVFRRPGAQYHTLALMKNWILPRVFNREGMKLQLRAEFYNVFNHPNLYVPPGTNDVSNATFNVSNGATVAGVTLRRGDNGAGFLTDNRQIVMAVKWIF